jgi:hypothetical protein
MRRVKTLPPKQIKSDRQNLLNKGTQVFKGGNQAQGGLHGLVN